MDIVTYRADELIRSGYEARQEGRLDAARQRFSDSVQLCRADGNSSLLASSLAGLGQIERDLKNREAALRCYEEAVAVLRTCGADLLRLAHTIRHLADILRGDGAPDAATPLYEEALQIYRKDEGRSVLDLANTIRGFALLKDARGEREEARRLWEEARGLYESVHVQAGVEESERQIARLVSG